MGIILTTTGLPLLSIGGHPIAGAAFAEDIPFPEPKPDPEPRQPDPDPGPAEFDLNGPVHEIAYRGATFTFSEPVYWLESANGDPVVITSEEYLPRGTSITSISPASAITTINGTDYKISGAVKNPVHRPAGRGTSPAQGFDERMTVRPSGAIRTDYQDTLNIDPANAGSPIVVAQGDTLTVVKAVCDPALPESSHNYVEDYVPLTFIDHLPPRVGTWFRPSVSEKVKEWPRLPVEEMDFTGGPASPLRNLPPLPKVESPGYYVDKIRNDYRSVTIPIWADTGESGRALQLVHEGSSSYSEYISTGNRLPALASLFTEWGGQHHHDRVELGCLLVQWGIDRDGAQRDGDQDGGAGAGQYWGYHPFYYLAAFMLQDPDMLERCSWHRSNALSQTFWVREPFIGHPVRWNTGSDSGNVRMVSDSYPVEMLGMPEWTKENGWKPVEGADGKELPENYPPDRQMSSYWRSVYRGSWGGAGPQEVIPIYLLRNGPNGETGADVVNKGLPVSVENVASSPLPYTDRTMTWNIGRDFYYNSRNRAIYDAWRDYIPQLRWAGQPDAQADYDKPAVFTAGSAGEISVDLSDYGFSTKQIKSREVSYSLDQIQFTPPIEVEAEDTVAGLREGTEYFLRWRQINVDDEPSMWSQTWRQRSLTSSASSDAKRSRNRVTTTGSPSGDFVNTALPELMYKPYPLHPMPLYEKASAADRTEIHVGVKLYAGIGFWEGGHGKPTVDYDEEYETQTITGWEVTRQWKRDGVAIEGATSFAYTIQEEDRGTILTCEVVVEGQSVTSPGIAIQSEPVLADLRVEQNGPISLTPSVFTSTPRGTIHWVVTESSSPPSRGQILAGQDHLGSPAAYYGQDFPDSIGVREFETKPNTLAPLTRYHVHAVQVDDEHNESAVISSAAIRTGAPGSISLLNRKGLWSDTAWGARIPLSLPMPETVRAGSLLVICLRNQARGADPDVPFVDGWDLYAETKENQGIQIYTRVADGTEGGTSLEWLSGAAKVAGFMLELADTTPVSVVGAAFDHDTTNPPALDLAGESASFWVAGFAKQRSTGSIAEGPNEYDAPEIRWSSEKSIRSANECAVAIAHKRGIASLEDPSEFVIGDQAQSVAFTLAMRSHG